MSDRLLDRFLEKGLLDLKGNDEWYGHILSTAKSLSTYLRANPEQLIPFTYAALLPKDAERDPAIARTHELLKAQWKTYASVSIESPHVLLRAIILDALQTNAESEDATKSALAMLLASALPHLSVGREGQIWKRAVDDLLDAVEQKAEVAWSVPARISIPEFPTIPMPTIRMSVQGIKIKQDALQEGMYAAAGPHDEDGESTDDDPNPHWPNSGHQWSYEFAPRAASAIGKAISEVSGARTASVSTKPIANALTKGIVGYLEAVVGHIASTTHGVEMRSRLLWWKEALMSPSSRVSYRDIDCKGAPGLMAFDYQAMLPSLAPASVSAFLVETVRTLQPDDQAASLVEWLQALAELTHAEALRETIRDKRFAHGYRPLVSLVTLQEPGASAIEEFTVFAPDHSLSPAQFSLLIFLELQALKAAAEIEPTESTEDDTNDKERA